MTFLLAVDPGISSGWSIWATDGTLLECSAGPAAPVESAPVKSAVIECPQVYPGPREADPNDLIKLALQTGGYKYALEKRGIDVLLVKPRVWKGQVPKQVHHPRILASVRTDAERLLITRAAARLTTAKARGDMIDAVGLGLWYFRSGQGAK